MEKRDVERMRQGETQRGERNGERKRGGEMEGGRGR